MRLLVVTNAYPSSEKPYAGVFVQKQVDRLRDASIDVSVFAMRRAFTGLLGSVWKYLSAFSRFLPRLLTRYDVVHVHFLSPLLLPSCLYRTVRPQSRLVLTVHGTGVRRLESQPILCWSYRVLLKRVDAVQAVGRVLAADFTRLLERPVDLVLPAGVDRAVFHPMPGEEKTYDFIFVGSLTRTKGFDILLDAIKMVRPGPRTCVIGSGEFSEEAARLERATYLRSLPAHHVAREMNRARFLVLPTRMDAFGLVVAEAMSCGIPAIVAPVDGMIEQVVDGKNGFLVDPPTAQQLARVMERALAIDAPTYAKLRAGALDLNPDYSLEAVCNRLIQLYETQR